MGSKKKKRQKESGMMKWQAEAFRQEEAERFPMEDLALKSAAQGFGSELIPELGIEQQAVGIAPTELVHLEMHTMHMDFNYWSADGALMHFEFESDSLTVEDMRRFREYEATASRTWKVPVYTYVVCSSNVRKLKSSLTEGFNTYHVKTIRLKDKKAETVFARLEKRKIQKSQPKKEELVAILLTPLMSGNMSPSERITAGFRWLEEAQFVIDQDERLRMESVLYAFAMKFLSKEELKEVKEVITMTILGKMLRDDGIAIGKEMGKEIGEDMLGELTIRLLEESRFTDLQKAAKDSLYRKKLYQEYGISLLHEEEEIYQVNDK